MIEEETRLVVEKETVATQQDLGQCPPARMLLCQGNNTEMR
jgi:hypothetical protein